MFFLIRSARFSSKTGYARCLWFIACLSACIFAYAGNGIVLSTKRIIFEEFPDAFNPSLIKVDKGYLMAFRYTPNRWIHPGLSYIGIVQLDVL